MEGVLKMEGPPDRVCRVTSMGEKEPIPAPQTLKLKISQLVGFLDTQASLSPSVSPLVRWSYFRISHLLSP